MRWQVRPSRLAGDFSPPGDKSIAHRALLIGALATGKSVVSHLPDGQDVRSSLTCLRRLGVEVDLDGTHTVIQAQGELVEPERDLDAGNSGTTTRLLAGILAGQSFASRIAGDASLSRRPMERVAEPLRRMGAVIHTTEGHLPMTL